MAPPTGLDARVKTAHVTDPRCCACCHTSMSDDECACSSSTAAQNTRSFTPAASWKQTMPLSTNHTGRRALRDTKPARDTTRLLEVLLERALAPVERVRVGRDRAAVAVLERARVAQPRVAHARGEERVLERQHLRRAHRAHAARRRVEARALGPGGETMGTLVSPAAHCKHDRGGSVTSAHVAAERPTPPPHHPHGRQA